MNPPTEKAGKQLRKSWVVSPEVAMDFAQPCRRLSETQWCTLAHRLARVSDPREELTARILDRVARLQHERLQDWEFKQQIKAFRNEAMSRLPSEEVGKFHQWIESEVSAFLARQQIANGDQTELSLPVDAPLPSPNR